MQAKRVAIMKFIASKLVGRMIPSIFTYLGVGKKPRFPGDPWPNLNGLPAWYWMHSDACRDDPAGAGHALCSDKRVASALLEPRAAHVDAPAPAAVPLYRPAPGARQPDFFTGTHQ